MSDITNPRFVDLSGEGLDKRCPNGINVTKILKSNSKIVVVLTKSRQHIVYTNGDYGKTGVAGLREWGESVSIVTLPDEQLNAEYCKHHVESHSQQFGFFRM